MLEQNKIVEHIHNIFTVPCEKSKMVSFTSSIMKNVIVFPSRSRFAIKLICCIVFGSASFGLHVVYLIYCYHLITIFEIGII